MNTVPEMFESVAARFASLPALTDETRTLTYRELNEEANRLAHRLIADGIGPDSIVGVSVQKSSDLIVAILAVLKAGGAYLPLDPGYPADRLSLMLSDARPDILLRSSSVPALSSRLPELVLDSSAVRHSCADLSERNVEQHERTAELNPEHLMYVIYTSGSTGAPKGVAVPHAGVRDMVATQAAVLGVGPGDRVLQWASISFDAAFWDVTLALLSGATLVMAPADDLLPGHPLRETLLKRGITHAVLPPIALSETDAEGTLVNGTVISTGDSCTPMLIRKWAPGRRMFNGYGPTEVTVGATLGGPVRNADDVGIGTPWIGNQVHVLGTDMQPVPFGSEGELYIAGSGLARGYLNAPATTSAKFVANPFGPPCSLMYRTGDRGRMAPDGELSFAGRADGQVKLRGFRVELGEIEAHLATHPAVAVAVAVIRGDLADAHVLAYVTTTTRVGPEELRAHVARALPLHMVPAKVIELGQFPTLSNGKVDRKSLSARNVGPIEAPRERLRLDSPADAICAMVRDLLDVPEVRITDNFFELGGQSVQATRLAGRIRKEFKIELPIRTVLTSETLGDLTAAVEALRTDV